MAAADEHQCSIESSWLPAPAGHPLNAVDQLKSVFNRVLFQNGQSFQPILKGPDLRLQQKFLR
jgi:hypothetical protein